MHNLLQQAVSKDKLLILENFTARQGHDFELWKGVPGRHRIGSCSDSECLLLEFCSDHQLVITNTLFQQKDRFKVTWRHPRSKHWHILDYALTWQHDMRHVLHIREMFSADCFIDHRLHWYKVTFTFKYPPKGKGPQVKKLPVLLVLSASCVYPLWLHACLPRTWRF